MTEAICLESQRIAEELYALIRVLESSRWRKEMDLVREKITGLSMRIGSALENPELSVDEETPLEALRERLQSLSRLIRDAVPSHDEQARRITQEWQSFRKHLIPAYEALATHLQLQDIHLPALRPTNYGRNLFHILSGLFVLVLLQYIFPMSVLVWIAGSFAVTCWFLETTRRYFPRLNKTLMAFFGPIAHPHETYRVNSATWYVTALFVLTLTVPTLAATLAVMVLAFSDPAAAFIGRKYGKIKLYAGRSLEGSLTFFGVGLAISLLVLRVYYPHLSFSSGLVLAVSGVLPATFAELYSKRIDDNLTIPLATAAGTALALFLLGVPL